MTTPKLTCVNVEMTTPKLTCVNVEPPRLGARSDESFGAV